MKQHNPDLARVLVEIAELEGQLEALRGDARDTPSAWGDLQPARELLQLRLQVKRELAVIMAMASPWPTPDECNFAPLSDPAPHRQNYAPKQSRPWLVLGGIGLAMVAVAVAMMLHAAGVLTQ